MAQGRTPDHPEDLKQVFASLARVYSTCRTYQDQGVVREGMPDEDGVERISESFFSTVFDRSGNRFRFEFRTGSPHKELDQACVVWRNGDSAKLWTRLTKRIEAVENVGLAVAGAVGNCGEPAFLIPNLLSREEVSGRGLLDLSDLRLVGEERFNNSDCLRIYGLYPSRSKLTVWVEKKTFLILKAEEETPMTLQVGPRFRGIMIGSGPLVTKTSIIYSPRVNSVIPTAKFEMLILEE